MASAAMRKFDTSKLTEILMADRFYDAGLVVMLTVRCSRHSRYLWIGGTAHMIINANSTLCFLMYANICPWLISRFWTLDQPTACAGTECHFCSSYSLPSKVYIPCK